MPYNILMKRYNGSTWDELYPKTDWANISGKPLVQLEIISMVDTVAKDTLGGSFTWQINTLYFVRFVFGNSVANITINGVGVYLGANPVNTTTFTLVANSTVLMYYDKTLNRLQITGSYRNFDASDGTEQDLSPIYFQLFKKANINGYYQGLSVGQADNAKELIATSGVSDSDSYMLRTTAGSQSVSNGLRNDTAVKGKTYVLNQLINIANYPVNKTENNVSFTKNTTTGEITVVVGSGGATGEVMYTTSIPMTIVGHKYLLRGGATGGSSSTYHWLVPYNSQNIGPDIIGTASQERNNAHVIISNGCPTGTYIFRPQLIDLTKMYGLGNEPTTVAQFYKDFGSGFIPYNTGSFINAKPLYFKSNGLNQWSNDEYKRVVGGNTYKYLQTPTISTYTLKEYDKDKNEIKTSTITYNNTFTLANNTVFIKILDNGVATKQFLWLPWSDYGNLTINDWQPYIEHTREIIYFDKSGDDIFSDGMGEWDYKDYVNRKNVKGTGVVDLGTLNWTYDDVNQCFITYKARKSGKTNYMLIDYTRMGFMELTSMATAPDKIIANGYGSAMFIKDTSYTDATTFKTAMSGVMLYYELETPNILDMPSTETSTLEVDDHGIEWVENATGYLAPCKIDAVYLSQLKRSIENNLDKFNSFITALASYNGSQITSITWNSDFTICTINTV